MNLGFAGRVALVAGGSAGLGKAAALALAREGAAVALCSRDQGRAEDAAREIVQRTGAQVWGAKCDVEDATACRRWVKAALARFGKADILIHNAGGPPPGALEELGDEQWTVGWERNLLSAVRLVRLVLPGMKARRWGRVLFIGSTSAKQPIAGLAISNALRAGILGLSKTLANEAGPFNVTSNVVCPGYASTERLVELARRQADGKNVAAVYKQWAQTIPLRRLGRPEEVADAVAFLASERAGYINGTVLAVDGGRTASPF